MSLPPPLQAKAATASIQMDLRDFLNKYPTRAKWENHRDDYQIFGGDNPPPPVPSGAQEVWEGHEEVFDGCFAVTDGKIKLILRCLALLELLDSDYVSCEYDKESHLVVDKTGELRRLTKITYKFKFEGVGLDGCKEVFDQTTFFLKDLVRAYTSPHPELPELPDDYKLPERSRLFFKSLQGKKC